MKRPKPRENDMDDVAAWMDPYHPAVEYARAMGKYANYLEAELATHKARAETERLCAKEALNQAEIEAARANTREKERDEEAVERKAVRWKIHADVIASERNDALARVRDAESERDEVKRSERLALDDARGFLPDEVSLTCAQEAVHILAGERDAARKEVELLKQTCEIGGSGAMLEKLQVERDAARVSRDHWRENSEADAAHRDRLADALRGVRHELWGGSEGVAPSQRIIDTALADTPEPKQSRGPISPEWGCHERKCQHIGSETQHSLEQCYAPDDVLCPVKPEKPPAFADRYSPGQGRVAETIASRARAGESNAEIAEDYRVDANTIAMVLAAWDGGVGPKRPSHCPGWTEYECSKGCGSWEQHESNERALRCPECGAPSEGWTCDACGSGIGTHDDGSCEECGYDGAHAEDTPE